jgi:hypothetical protein
MDVINQFVSVEKALEAYKVALDPETLEVNKQKTALLRAQEKPQ